MTISKKDRIALVASILITLISGGFLLIPVLIYWGYRFIQNDISFLKVKDNESQQNTNNE